MHATDLKPKIWYRGTVVTHRYEGGAYRVTSRTEDDAYVNVESLEDPEYRRQLHWLLLVGVDNNARV